MLRHRLAARPMADDLLISKLLSKHPLISDQIDKTELKVILASLEKQLDEFPDGAVVEFGCYIGTTSLFIRRLMDIMDTKGVFHVYDSFEGLPSKTSPDLSPAGEQFKQGELTASRKLFIQQFKKAQLKAPYIHKGWFSNLEPVDVPDNIGFAYLDGDYYESIKDSLRLIWPKLISGAIVIIDDYMNEALPGAAKAVNEWLKLNTAQLKIESSLAIIKKP
jgi:O-methyltransferase